MSARTLTIGPTFGPRIGVAGDAVSSTNTTLTVAMADSADPVMTLAPYSYAVVVTNTGAITATSVSAVVALDASLAFVSGSGTGWSVGAVGQTVTCTRASLAVGAAPTITINVTSGAATVTASSTADASASNAPAATQSAPTTSVLLVSKDATSGIRCPAGSAEWTSLMTIAGVATGNPGSLWLDQEASGASADSIGAVTCTMDVALPAYRSAVTGWSRLALRNSDGTSLQRWFNNSTAPNPRTTSTLQFSYIEFPAAAPALQRGIMAKGGAGAQDVRLDTTGKIAFVDGATTLSTGVISNAVHPVLFLTNITNSTSKLFLDTEKITGTFVLPANGSIVGFGALSTATAAACAYLYSGEFSGAAAELTDAQVKTLMQTLGWTIPWT